MRPRSFSNARDLLDRYAALSPKLHVQYIDPVKKPQLAKAAGYRRDAPVLMDSGTRKEEAKSLTEEEVTGALIRVHEDRRAQRLLPQGGGRAQHRPTKATAATPTLKQILERDNYKTVRTTDLRPAAPDAGRPLAIGQTPAAASVEIPKTAPC